MKVSATKWYSIISGTVFLLLLLVFFAFVPCPSNPQLNFFRILLSLAGGAFAATIPGLLKMKKSWLTATSSMAVFAIIYLVNPAGWKDSPCNLQNLTATVYIDDKLAQGVEITIPDIGRRFLTDEFGNVNIEYSSDQIKYPVVLIFKYKSDVDTTFRLTKLDNKMEFRLLTKKTGLVSIQGNSINYTYKDITINLSLIDQVTEKDSEQENEIDTFSESEPEKALDSLVLHDIVTYSLGLSGDTILIRPNSTLLALLTNNEPIPEFYSGSFEMNLPQFDIKFTNNSTDAIFFNKLTLEVEKSTLNGDAIFIPWTTADDGSVGLKNVGWGTAKNVRIGFSTSNKYPLWGNGFEDHIEFTEWPSNRDSSLIEQVYQNLIRKGVNEQYLRSQKYFFPNDSDAIENAKSKAGNFLWGAYVYGTITFNDAEHIDKMQKFKTYLSLSLPPGGAVEDFSWNYNIAFKPKGENYIISIPMSNSVKPKDVDRISLICSSAQSSSHCFRLKFYYNDKEYEIPYVFKLDYFIRADMIEYLQNAKTMVQKSASF